MNKEIFLSSDNHSPEALQEIFVLNNEGTGLPGAKISAKDPGTRSLGEVLTFLAENNATLLTLLGSLLTAWKLYQEQQKLRIEAQKLKLEKDKHAIEKARWEKEQQKKPELIHLFLESGEEMVLPFDLDTERIKDQHRKRLEAQRVENLKGISFE